MPASRLAITRACNGGSQLLTRFGKSEIKRLEAALDKFKDRTVPQGYIETVLGDILRTRNMSSIRQKLSRLREERVPRQGFSKREEDRLRAESGMYLRHYPNRVWTEAAIRNTFPDLLQTHTFVSLKAKLNRLRHQSVASQSDAMCSSSSAQDTQLDDAQPRDTQLDDAQPRDPQPRQSSENPHRQSRLKRYTDPELVVLRRSALTNQMPTYEEMRTVLRHRSAVAVAIKIKSVRTAMQRSKPQ